MAISAADGEISASEERHLLAYLERALHLSAASRTRLKAHLRWLIAAPPGLNGLKKKIEPLAETQRREIGQFLITVAGADGHVGAEELKLLARIYPLLGLEAQSVYSDVHALGQRRGAAGCRAGDGASRRAGSRRLPDPARAAAGRNPARPAEDPGQARRERGRRRVCSKGSSPPTRSPLAGAEAWAADCRAGPSPVAGLDAIHSSLLRRLAAKAVWERVEIERLAAEFGLLPDGALEVINEAAFERCGAPLLEGDETLEVDGQVLEEILA